MLMESFADAVSLWQRSVRVSLVGTQQKQHLHKEKNTHSDLCDNSRLVGMKTRFSHLKKKKINVFNP